MEELTKLLSGYMPTQFDHLGFWKLFGLFCACVLVISLFGRLLGKRSSLHHALSAAIGIVCLYVLGAAVYCLKPEWSRLLTSLPFLSVSGDSMVIFPIREAAFSAICTQLLRMTILAFLINLLESWFPQGKGLIAWYALRFATLAAALVLQYAVFWLVDTYVPETVLRFAPAILIVLLLSSIIIGALKLLVGLFLATVNPLIAGLYAFFFINSTGKLLSRSAFTALLLAAVVYGLNVLGYTLITLTAAALLAFVPAVGVLLVLWYLVRRLL